MTPSLLRRRWCCAEHLQPSWAESEYHFAGVKSPKTNGMVNMPFVGVWRRWNVFYCSPLGGRRAKWGSVCGGAGSPDPSTCSYWLKLILKIRFFYSFVILNIFLKRSSIGEIKKRCRERRFIHYSRNPAISINRELWNAIILNFGCKNVF